MDMKDIMLKITGRQFVGNEEAEDSVEFITEGKMSEKNGATYILYDESELSGFPGCTTTLKFKDDRIVLKRIGKNKEIASHMEFEPGLEFRNKYNTPYGAIDMIMRTSKIENDLNEAGIGTVDIEFLITLKGLVTDARNELRIEVSEAK